MPMSSANSTRMLGFEAAAAAAEKQRNGRGTMVLGRRGVSPCVSHKSVQHAVYEMALGGVRPGTVDEDPFPEMQAFAPAFLAKRSRRPRHRDQPLAEYAKALVTLHLEGAGLQALLSFRHAPALRVLYAQANELEEAGEALATCPHLTDLFLGGNRIASMGAGLRWCMYLRVLHIGGNCLEVIEGLENLFCLEELHAEDQNLALRRQGGGGAAQPPVRLLYADLPPSQQQQQQQQQEQQQQLLLPPPPLEFCEASFQNVGHRGKLLSLDLSGNGLRAIEPALLCLRALQKLNLSNNALGGADALGALLAACGALRELDTRGNPMHGLRDCRSRLVVLAPQTLVELDGLAVLEAQRVGLMRLEGHRRRLRRAGGGGAGSAARHRVAAAAAGAGGSPERVQSPGGNVISGGAQLFGGSSPHASSQSAQDVPAPGASPPPRPLPLLPASAAAAAAHRVVVRNEHTWAGKTLGSRTSSKGMIARPPRRQPRRQQGHLHKAQLGGGDALDQHMAAPQGGAAAQRAAAGQSGAVLSARPSVHGAMTPTVFAQAGQALSRNSSHVFFRH